MNATSFPTKIPPDVLREVQEVIAMLQSGVRPSAAERKRAAERMDRFRAEDYARNGVKDFGVEAIRELRDDE